MTAQLQEFWQNYKAMKGDAAVSQLEQEIKQQYLQRVETLEAGHQDLKAQVERLNKRVDEINPRTSSLGTKPDGSLDQHS